MPQSVAIFGGGIAGLTAAHELACRGFTVDVYERRAIDSGVGGKARTQFWTSAAGGGVLPGEHGFRFFPAFYHLVEDTMTRIPLDPNAHDPADGLAPVEGRSALDNLAAVPNGGVGKAGSRVLEFPRRSPQDFTEIVQLIRLYFQGMDIPPVDLLRMGLRLTKFYLSGDRRRLEEYEGVKFWDFIEGDQLGPAAQAVLQSAPKCAVAMNAKEGNARTLGNLLFLMMRDQLLDGTKADRTLRGPTTRMWLQPWRGWLERLGVRFHNSVALRALDCSPHDKRIVKAHLSDATSVEADHYLVALPLDAIQPLIDDTLAGCCEQLDRILQIDLDRSLGWMVGAQFYLRRNVALPGHVVFPEAPWSLTAISQAQFWSPTRFRTDYGNGVVAGILSVDICGWDTPGPLTGKPATACTRQELLAELVEQLGAVLTQDGDPILAKPNLVDWHLDEDIAFSGPHIVRNDSRLLIHPPNLWEKRPTAVTTLRNLFLAADYVRNDIDLATMEGANEAARAAVNGILDRAGYNGPRCLLVNHLQRAEPAWLRLLKAADDQLFPGVALFDTPVPMGLAHPTPVTAEEHVWQRLAGVQRQIREGVEAASYR